MNKFILSSKKDAEDALTKLVLKNNTNAKSIPDLLIQVREDKCFENKWVTVGKIEIFPELPMASVKDAVTDTKRIMEALRLGFFEWSIPSQNELKDEIELAVPKNQKNGNENQKANREKKIIEATKTVAHVAMRCGLAHPVFDALTLGHMQSRKPLSVVVDTSAVLQGGLDFFARNVAPRARIKVPALVHMEILNFCERYFSQRRKESCTPQMLLDHLNGQGGQRVLLRLETDQEVEFERPRLGADPLRGVVAPDSDAEDKNLGLQQVQRSFADRLILETAVQQRNQVGHDHPVMLLTSDQGLARMALAESIQPIFFDSNAVSQLFGNKLSGIGFRPFSVDGPKFQGVGLVDVLWEFAATFGASRLTRDVDKAAFEVVALGEEVAWQPYHSYEDLLWTREDTLTGVKIGAGKESDHEAPRKDVTEGKPRRSSARAGAYSFSLGSMLRLLGVLHKSGEVSDDMAMSVVKVGSVSSYGGYQNFLVAGGFATHESGMLQRTERLHELFIALRDGDHLKISELLGQVASFQSFLNKLSEGTALGQSESELGKDSFRSYGNLAEICCLGVRFVDQGIFGTPNNPRPAEFVGSALEAYEAVRAGEGFALTGAWLEKLAIQYGIHPVRARQRLSEGHQGGYVHRFFEGSTPDTRFENRTMRVLEVDQGQPIVRTVNLYHGDFLMPGRASVGIKLSKGEK